MTDDEIRTLLLDDVEPPGPGYWSSIDQLLESVANDEADLAEPTNRRFRPERLRSNGAWLAAAAMILLAWFGATALVSTDGGSETVAQRTSDRQQAPPSDPVVVDGPEVDGGANLATEPVADLLAVPEGGLVADVLTRSGDELVLSTTSFVDSVHSMISIPQQSPLHRQADAPMLSDGDGGLLAAVDGTIFHADRQGVTTIVDMPTGIDPTTSVELLRFEGADGPRIAHIGADDSDYFTIDGVTLRPDDEPIRLGSEDFTTVRTVESATVSLVDDGSADTYLEVIDDRTGFEHRLRVSSGRDPVTIVDFDGQQVILAITASETTTGDVLYRIIDIRCTEFSCLTETVQPGPPSSTLIGTPNLDIPVRLALPDIDRVDRFNRRPPTAVGSYEEYRDRLLTEIGSSPCCDSGSSDLAAWSDFMWNGEQLHLAMWPGARALATEHPMAGVDSDTVTAEGQRVLVSGWEGRAATIFCGDHAVLVAKPGSGEGGGTVAPPAAAVDGILTAMETLGCAAP